MRTHIFVILVALLWVTDDQSAHATQADLLLAKSEVIEIVHNTAKEFEAHYLFPEKTEQVTLSLRTMLAAGDFEQSFTFDRLKHLLESTVINVTGDSNFELLQRMGLARQDEDTNTEQVSIVDAQILEHNIGYLALTGDFVLHDSRRDITKAFTRIHGVNALILDLRDVGLGSVELAQHLTNFFTEPDTYLAHIHFGRGDKQPLVSSEIAGFLSFNQDFPVFILTSSFVAGPWEFLVHTLKHLERATIVGEDTIGLGRMTTLRPVSEQVSILFSYAEIKLESTGESWQKWGVIADHQTSAEASFEMACQLAFLSIHNHLHLQRYTR